MLSSYMVNTYATKSWKIFEEKKLYNL